MQSRPGHPWNDWGQIVFSCLHHSVQAVGQQVAGAGDELELGLWLLIGLGLELGMGPQIQLGLRHRLGLPFHDV